MESRFEKRDVAQCENLIKAIKKAKFELDGMEVLAFAEVMRWVNGLYNKIQAEVQLAEAPKALVVKDLVPPITEAPKSVENPVKLAGTPKKNRK